MKLFIVWLKQVYTCTGLHGNKNAYFSGLVDNYRSTNLWILHLEPSSHETSLLSPFYELVHKCTLFYDRVVVESLSNKKKVKLILGGVLRNY